MKSIIIICENNIFSKFTHLENLIWRGFNYTYILYRYEEDVENGYIQNYWWLTKSTCGALGILFNKNDISKFTLMDYYTNKNICVKIVDIININNFTKTFAVSLDESLIATFQSKCDRIIYAYVYNIKLDKNKCIFSFIDNLDLSNNFAFYNRIITTNYDACFRYYKRCVITTMIMVNESKFGGMIKWMPEVFIDTFYHPSLKMDSFTIMKILKEVIPLIYNF